MKVTLKNDFHNTEITLVSKDYYLSADQIKKAKQTLCCADCTCSNEAGQRGDGVELEFFSSGIAKIIGGWRVQDSKHHYIVGSYEAAGNLAINKELNKATITEIGGFYDKNR